MKWSRIERSRQVLSRERGAIVKDWGGKLPIVLVYPNTYHVGMSSLGLHSIYRLFNARADVVCERAFWQPGLTDDDPIASIETQQSIADFGVVAFSVSFEMDYPHIVDMLRQAGIPLLARERADEGDGRWPVVIAGGAAVSANPLPIADLVDGVAIGEAEEIADPLIDVLWEGASGPRHALWQDLARIPGVYAPHHSPDTPSPVERQWVRDLESHPTATVIHTPDTEFSGTHLIEVARGCGRGCRFCMAGFITRPKREHSVGSIVEQARQGLAWGDRVGLVGAAVSDYTQIDALATRLREMDVRLSVSSLRVDPLSEPLLRALAESGAQTLTLAPEAGSQRLRQAINKNVTTQDVLHAAKRAAHYRFRQLRLYFMLGLPGETDDDAAAIADLCQEVSGRFPGQLTASVAPFVPKAHTPFQWAAMAPQEVIEARLKGLEGKLRRQRIQVKGESPRWSAIQGVLARGDRRLSSVLTSLRGRSLRAWLRAMAAHDVEPEDYLRARAPDEVLPWSFIHTGVDVRYLQAEWERAGAGAATPPCPPADCARCGLCEQHPAPETPGLR